MSARGVVLLLSWLSCCGLALWRYSINSKNFLIFNTRSTIKLEYEGTSFSEWSVPQTCSIKDKSSPRTELRCSSAGVQTIKPIVTGPDVEEERYLSIANSYICFLWYYHVTYFPDNKTQMITIWIYDPENAAPDELQWIADKPSVYSVLLSKLLASLGQKPVIHTILRRKVYFPNEKMDNGTWHITIPMTDNDILMEIKGKPVALQDCFTADSRLQLTYPLWTMAEVSGYLPISSPRGSQLMADWDACFPSVAVVVADMETFQTNDSFQSWTRVRVPPNMLSDEDRHKVSDVSFSRDGIFLLIIDRLFIRRYYIFLRLGKLFDLPDDGIIGITSRKWCWTNYLLKEKEKRSNVAIWTKHEVYLEYSFLTFAKVMTTDKLKGHLHLPPSSTVVIHNVEYTGHPLELALLLEYCTTCTNLKQMFLVIYNEDTTHVICKDFTLDISVNSFLIPYFIYSAIPELVLWDKHKIYYSYNNLTDTGVVQTPTEFGNLSKLSHDSTIHDVVIDYDGNVVVKMENNIMFYFKVKMRDAVKLHLWTNSMTKSIVSLDTSGQVYLIYVFQNGTIQPQKYPLKMEVQSVAFKTKEKCPFVAFESSISHPFHFFDKGDKLSVWAEIVYPENIGLSIIVESYGPKILDMTDQISYDIGFGHCTKTLTGTFSHNLNYEAVGNYFKLQDENTGLVLVHMRPSENGKTCPIAQKVFQIAVGCDTSKYIAIKGFKNEGCLQHDLFYIIEKSYLRHQPQKNLRVKYDWNKYGCPLKLDFRKKSFHPLLQLYNDSGYVEDITVNFIVWEIHGRNDYSFSNTMKKSGCLHEAQTWKSMTELNKDLPLEDAWGPQNYKHCFSYAIGKPGDLNQPYEIINKSNHNHLVWPMDHAGMYVFRVKILDPNYSFCNLTATFAIETPGVIPRPSGYVVGAILFLLMLIVFSILVLSYFHYMKIYKKYVYEPTDTHQGKRKDN